MKIIYLIICCLLSLCGYSQEWADRNRLFDFGWKFHRGGYERGYDPALNDSDWRTLDLPHDWSIEDLPETNSPFSPDAISQTAGGFTTGGTGWYRKDFECNNKDKAKHILILFEGVYMNSDIWINGFHLGNHVYGYSSFWYDLTPYLKFGEKNSIAVQVKNEGQNSRWYSGSGINRHVWLKMTEPIYVDPWGISVATKMQGNTVVRVNVRSHIVNKKNEQAPITLLTRLLSPEGVEVGRSSDEFSIHEDSAFVQEISIAHPVLWALEAPQLYTTETTLYDRGTLMDQVRTPFGIRTFTVDASRGLLFNGKSLKLKGACFHDDNGPLGSVSYDRAEERRVELLKAAGFNAIRCSHNPPAPAFLDACDRLGMLVIDEAFDMWEEAKMPNDYHLYFQNNWRKDLDNMVIRDLNHPSVIMWSIGNEIPNAGRPDVIATAKQMVDEIKKLDSSRPVTQAVNIMGEIVDPAFAVLDVAGYNYGIDQFVTDHSRKPERVMLTTESYALESYDYWKAVTDHNYVIGDFVWTGFDYIGEASIGWRGYFPEKNFYPWNLAFCGDIDICGWRRPQSFYRDVLWNPDRIHVFVAPQRPSFPVNTKKQTWSKWNWEDVAEDWSWPGKDGENFKVIVYSSCESVELFLNDKSLGIQSVSPDSKNRVEYMVPYQRGLLKAVGYDQKKIKAISTIQTPGKTYQLKAYPDREKIRSNGQDLVYVTVEAQDAQGIRDPKGENQVRFELEGPGKIIGVGNANPISVESNQSPQRKLWGGKCMVIIKSDKNPGEMILHMYSDGLKNGVLSVQSVK